MKRIGRFLKNNVKVLLAFLIGLSISITTVYGATILFTSDQVGYDNTNTGFKDSNNQDVTDMQTALDELYNKASACSIRNICPVGMKRVEGVNGEYSCVNPKSPESYIKSLNTEGETISTSDHYNELRFIGANPPNYVKFNGNQTWRIIGIFDGKLKLVANPIGNYSFDTSKETVNRGLGVNAWEDSDLMKLLNPGYESNTDLKCKTNTSYVSNNGDGYAIVNCGDNSASAYEDTNPLVNNSLYWNAGSGLCYTYGNYQASSCSFTSSGLTDQTSKNMIDDATWYLGSNSASADLWGAGQIMTASYMYDFERGNLTGKQCSNAYYCSDTVTRNNPPTWTGKVGLIYPSDYAYATSGSTSGTDRDTCLGKQIGYVSSSSTPNWSNTYTDCKDNDWLLNKSMWTWSLSPRAYSSRATGVFDVHSTGNVIDYNALNAGSVRPVVYLKSSVTITRGDGTQSKPFELSIN